jgi:hypothetical protein
LTPAGRISKWERLPLHFSPPESDEDRLPTTVALDSKTGSGAQPRAQVRLQTPLALNAQLSIRVVTMGDQEPCELIVEVAPIHTVG